MRRPVGAGLAPPAPPAGESVRKAAHAGDSSGWVREVIRKEIHHGTLGTSKHLNSREPQRPRGSRRRSGKTHQAGNPRHGKSVFTSENTVGGFDCGPAHAREKTSRKRGHGARLDAQSGNCRGQTARRFGPRGAGPFPDFAAPRAELPRAGGRPKSSSRNAERSACETRTET